MPPPMDDPEVPQYLMDVLDTYKNLTGVMTGLRTDLVGRGWSPGAAEQLCVTTYQHLITSLIAGATA